MQRTPFILLLTVSCALGNSKLDYPLKPVPFTAVRIQDGFWTPRIETNRQTTVWYDFLKCEETGRIDNFAKAGGLIPGKFRGTPFDDSDVFKVIQGAAYTLATHPDPKLDAYLDALIAKIGAAQEADGYLYTARTLKSGHSRAGKDRWLNERGGQTPGEDSHELYNLGHLYEAAAAHYEATGKTNLLTIARRSADLVAATWRPGGLEIASGHQEIEIGLVKLFRVTGEEKYLNLAKFLLDCRGNGKYVIPTGHYSDKYYSDYLPVTQQTEAVGHSVRSTYMYSAMADVAAIKGDTAYVKAIDSLWNSVVGRKIYLTGGIGADATTEGFGPDYALQNDAYNETCAAIGNALWNQRMFLLHGDAKYADVLERIIYNGFLSGVAMTGDKFFYPNPLVCDGQSAFNIGSKERAPWFGCSCCPVNDVRFIPEIAGFIYATHGELLYVNLFIGGEADVTLAGTNVKLTQQTRYPFDGHVRLTVSPQANRKFTLNIRIPGWVRNAPLPGDLYHYIDGLNPTVKLSVNGKTVKYDLVKGYAQVNRKWKTGDVVALDLEMPVRQVAAHPNLQAAANCIALERGPLVYCAEGADNNGKVLNRVLTAETTFLIESRPDLLGGIVTVKSVSDANDSEPLTLIPYYAWCHRGANEMRVWHPLLEVKQHHDANPVKDTGDKERQPPPPALPDFHADPHIAAFGDTFYIYPTTDVAGWNSPSFECWSSRDLKNWKSEGIIFDFPRDLKWANTRAWAPCIACRNGKYYFYYAAEQNIGVAVGDRPQGPFKDPLGKPLIAKDTYQCQVIDPMVFADDDGSYYLYFGNGNCNVVRLNDDMISFDPAAVERITPRDFGEGSFVLKRKGVYYLMWSQYDTRDPRYCVSYATSTSPLGPFTNATNNPILVQNGVIKGAGHHSVVQIPGRDEWVIAYHRFHIPDGDGYHRETCLSPMRFNEHGQIEKVNVFESAPALATAGNELPGLRKLMDTPLRDTSICRGPDGYYYLTGTVEPFFGFNEGIKLWRSKDLNQWESLGFVWKYGGSPWHKPYLDKKKSLWAPEVHYLKGTFWLTYSLPGWDGTGKTSGTGLLKSSTGKPEGPYVDMQPDERIGDEIDASLFQDDDGPVYFLWHSGKIARMKPDMSGLAEPYHWLKAAGSDPNPKHHSGLCAGIFGKDSFDHVGYEGMFLFKANGRYYLCCAENFEGRYSCTIAMGSSIYGPYGERYEALPHAGHNTFFKDVQGQWWSTYFGSDGGAPWQERPGLLPIEFDANGRVRPKSP